MGTWGTEVAEAEQAAEAQAGSTVAAGAERAGLAEVGEGIPVEEEPRSFAELAQEHTEPVRADLALVVE